MSSIACAAFALAACGQAALSRQAASPAPTGGAASPAPATDPDSKSALTGSVIRGSRICIVNNTTSTYAIDAKWTREQSLDRQGPIIGGVTACGRDYNSTQATNRGDVAADNPAASPRITPVPATESRRYVRHPRLPLVSRFSERSEHQRLLTFRPASAQRSFPDKNSGCTGRRLGTKSCPWAYPDWC